MFQLASFFQLTATTAAVHCIAKHNDNDNLTHNVHCAQHTHTVPFNGPFSGTIQVSQYQKGKTNLDFTGARDSEWQWC